MTFDVLTKYVEQEILFDCCSKLNVMHSTVLKTEPSERGVLGSTEHTYPANIKQGSMWISAV